MSAARAIGLWRASAAVLRLRVAPVALNTGSRVREKNYATLERSYMFLHMIHKWPLSLFRSSSKEFEASCGTAGGGVLPVHYSIVAVPG